MASTTECPSCGGRVDAGHRFCGACGSSLILACASCGSENPPGFRFCSGCGSALSAGTAVAEPSEARRWVTVLFGDLSGFTRLSERMDPEDVTALVDRCMRRLGVVLEEFGGYAEKIVGDEIMALFGAPTSHEDDPERAVRAALAMQECVAAAGDDFGGLRLRIGINTGEVMFAPVGPDSARRFTVMGDVVNTAARLEAAAPVGGVLVGEETYRFCGRAIRFEPVDAVHAKNKEDPVAAWLAVEAVTLPADRQAGVAPLVGRDKEVALLQSVWERTVADRRSHLVTVLGPPGIGKSRLVREVVDALDPAPGEVLRGRCLPYGDAAGYSAFAQQVKQGADVYETLETSEASARLHEWARELLPTGEAEEVAQHLSILAGIGSAAQVDKETLFFAARRIVEGLAETAPTVLVFEDIHWADAALLDLIESLAGRVRGAPVLFLCLARPELHDVRPLWGGGVTAFTTLPLEPLSSSDTGELARHITAANPDIDLDVARLVETAGGNPLFIEELVSSVVEGVGTSVAELPTTVRGIIAARLDALPAAARDALFDASVVGKVFWRSVLDQVGGPAVRDGLELLEQRDFVRRDPVSRLEGDQEFTFRHVLTRDVAYEMIPKAVRRERHGAVARALESTLGERSSEWAATLAYHYREAGDMQRAAAYLETAAESAGRAWAKGEAIRLCDEALALVPTSDAAWRQRLILRKAALLGDRGDFQGVIDVVRPLLPSLDGSDRVRGLILSSRASFWLADTPGARRYYQEATTLAESIGDVAAVGAALAAGVQVSSAEGKLDEGLALADKALSLLQQAEPDRRGTAGGQLGLYRSLVLSHMGLQHYWLGNAAEGAERCRLGYEIGLAEHNVEAALGAGAQYGMCLAGAGRYAEAFDVFRDVLAHGQEIELLPRLTGRVVAMWGGALRDIQDVAGSRRLNEEAGEMGIRSGFLNSQVQSAIDLLLLDLGAGDVGGVQARLPGVLEQSQALQGWHQWLVAGRLADVTARLHLAAGSPEEAAVAAEASIARAEGIGRAKYLASGRAVLAEALAKIGRLDDAVASASEALRVATTIDHLPSIWEIADLLSRLTEACGDDEAARAATQIAGSAVERAAASIDEEQRATFVAASRISSVLARTRLA